MDGFAAFAGRMLVVDQPAEHGPCRMFAETGDIAAHGAELRVHQRAFLDIVETDKAKILAQDHTGFGKSRMHAQGHEIAETDSSINAGALPHKPVGHPAADHP